MLYGTQKIRVVKRKVVATAGEENKPKRIPAPDIMATVNSWVDDLRDRKSRERKIAIEQFYSTDPALRRAATKTETAER